MHSALRWTLLALTAIVFAIIFNARQTPTMRTANMIKSTPPSGSSALTPAQFRKYNRLSEQMAFYHSLLRSKWDELYAGTAPDARSPSPSRLIRVGQEFCTHLKGHHDIEEAFWFPALGKKMESFRPGHFATEQHKEMHKGLDVLMPYLDECRRGERELRRQEVRGIMDSFREVLWTHLDEEVRELGAENMMRYWSLEEMEMFPF